MSSGTAQWAVIAAALFGPPAWFAAVGYVAARRGRAARRRLGWDTGWDTRPKT